jgi:hypothetical protein
MIFVVQEWNKANLEDYSKTRSICVIGVYLSACTKPGKWAVMYMCDRGFELAFVPTIFLFDFRNVQTVWYF